ncbi:MAG: nucleoside kinase [Bacilli bacterium]|nr:nucleoside kinase [Bacilli bacterium]
MYEVRVLGKNIKYEGNMLLSEIAKELEIEAYVAKVNNRMRELSYYVNYDCEVEFLDLNDFDAVRCYETSMRYIIIMALEKMYPGIQVKFNQCVSRSISCEILNFKDKIDVNFLEKLEAEMQLIVKKDIPIKRKKISKKEAIKLYSSKGYFDKVEVLKYRSEDSVNLYECDGYENYMFGYMVASTGYLKKYRLKMYNPNFVVQFPRAEEKGEIPQFEDSPIFGKMLADAQKWSNDIECNTIPKLNKYINNNTAVDLVNLCETKHSNMLAELGMKIKDNIEDIRVIAIAGPSSSGKTTFSNRLRIELMTRGIKPIRISMDDYYLDRDFAPKDENGKPDLEHIHALDIEKFNNDLLLLIKGEDVELPKFDFTTGKRLKGKKIRIRSNQPIIIEGIHALNEELTSSIPKHQKFKIYLSPLSQINIDNHNPINATDIRMLRRIVRDEKFRKTHPSSTFSMWSSVRRGEFKWIYPWQEGADYIFNTELTYELGVIKKYALPVLESINRDDKYFVSANRLVKFLKYFKDIDDRLVPCNSLLREFIGESCFY